MLFESTTFLTAVFIGCLVPLLVSLFFSTEKLTTEKRYAIFVILLSLATVGAFAGVAGGLSRTGVVGNLIPAVLTLLGGVVVYIFGVDTKKGLMASLGAMSLAVSMFVGYSQAGSARTKTDGWLELRAACLAAYRDHEFLAFISGESADAEPRFGDFWKDPCDKAMETITSNKPGGSVWWSDRYTTWQLDALE